MELLGWIGSLAFAICALPQAYKSYKEGHSKGISWGLLVLWTIGEWASLVYVLPMNKMPLVANYIGNIIFVSVITYYKVRPRNGKKSKRVSKSKKYSRRSSSSRREESSPRLADQAR